MNLILASTSKYRASQLEKLGVRFLVQAPQFDEEPLKKEGHTPFELSQLLALGKARSVAEHNPHDVVIGSDQVAHLDELLLSKPGSLEKAVQQLELMAGKVHTLTTSVAVIGPQTHPLIFTNQTHLHMRKLSTREIKAYLKKDEPFDCAGSYKIESFGISLFEKIETTDFSSIIGLPLLELNKVLRENFSQLFDTDLYEC